MKHLITLLFLLLLGSTVQAQLLDVPVYNAGFNQPAGTKYFMLKNWAGGASGTSTLASRWSPIDTTTWIDLKDLPPGDTTFIAYLACAQNTPYNVALKIQFANEDAIKAAYTLDSLVRVGPGLAAVAAGETAKDSILTGRSIFWLWRTSYAGATKARLMIAKDTTDAAVTDLGTTNSTTAKMRAGFLRQPRSK